MNKILIIFNPIAGYRYKKNFKEYFLKYFKKFLPGVKYDWLETTPNLDEQLTELNLNDYQRIISVGGDGTIKGIANYLLKNNYDVPLAIIPCGSANVLASSLNIPLTQTNAIKTACLGHKKKMDVCLLNGNEYFLICLSIGHWSKIVSDTERGFKIHLGALAYLLAFLKQWKVYRTLFKFNLDGKQRQIQGNTMVIANALSIFKLQPRTPVDLFDGQFEVIIGKNKTIFGFFVLAASFFLGKRKLPYLYKAKGEKIIIDYQSKKNKSVQIDGETIEVDKIEVKLISKKLTIISNDQN